jgi:hypothetical protein
MTRAAAGSEAAGPPSAHLAIPDRNQRKIENAKARMLVPDIPKLMELYGVTDPEVLAALTALARYAGKQGWWQTYGDVVELNYKDYLTLETDAASVHTYTPGIIPGLLQTGAYAREVITGMTTTLTLEEAIALAESARPVRPSSPGRETR